MKKIISFLICTFIIFALLPTYVFADDGNSANAEIEDGETTEAPENIALNGIAYSSSQKNSLWTPAKSINDGLDSSNDWHGWECMYPDITPGADTSDGFGGEYCGIKFLNHQYYEISEIKINLGLHGMYGNQNTKYTVSFLVEGEWVEVKTFYDSDTKPRNYESYDEAMKNDTSNYHIPADISISLDTPLTTNNVRITIDGYGKNYPGGDSLVFPYIYEVELMGITGKTPDVELPEGAVLSSNISYNSTSEVSSSARTKYAYLAIDGDKKTFWSPATPNKGESITVIFPESHSIDKVTVNFGEYRDGISPEDYSFDIEAFDGEKFVKIGEGNSFDSENKTLITEYNVSATTDRVRLVFTKDAKKSPELYELEINISDTKTFFLENRIDSFKRLSASKGNLAVFGEAYAERNFLPYSEEGYINDGKNRESAYVWFPGTLDFPVYCGVKLDGKYKVNKVALYAETPVEEGTDIMKFEIQALVDGKYVTIANGKSYHKITKYMTVYEFDAVETDDIRIVFTAGGGTIANVKELEIYSEEGVHPMFKGISQLEEPPVAPKEETALPQNSVALTDSSEITENKTEATVLNVSSPVLLISTVCTSIFIKKDKYTYEVENGRR